MNIRVATPADAEAITAIYAPVVENTSISFELSPPGIDEMRNVGRMPVDEGARHGLRCQLDVTPEGHGHQRLRATDVAVVAVEVFVGKRRLLVRRGVAGALHRLALVFVRVMPEVAHARNLFMLAIARGCAPGELELQPQQQHDDEEARHR